MPTSKTSYETLTRLMGKTREFKSGDKEAEDWFRNIEFTFSLAKIQLNHALAFLANHSSEDKDYERNKVFAELGYRNLLFAANKGALADAQYYLGKFLLDGEKVSTLKGAYNSKDYINEAKTLFARAAAEGHQEAKEELEKLLPLSLPRSASGSPVTPITPPLRSASVSPIASNL